MPGLLDPAIVSEELHEHDLDDRVRFERLYRRKRPLLWAAAARLIADDVASVARRIRRRSRTSAASWLDDTCLYFALHGRSPGRALVGVALTVACP